MIELLRHLSLWVKIPGAIAAVILAIYIVVVAGEAWCAAKRREEPR